MTQGVELRYGAPGVSEVTSADNSVTITRPHGPVVDLSVASTAGAKATRILTPQTVANNTGPSVEFDTVEFDDDGWIDLATDPTRVTVSTAGRFLVVTGCAWENIAAGGFPITQHILHSGVDLIGTQITYVTDTPGTISLSAIVEAAAGDYFELQIFQNSGGDMNTWYPGWLPLGVQAPPQLSVQLLKKA